jgi:hypothetical protein
MERSPSAAKSLLKRTKALGFRGDVVGLGDDLGPGSGRIGGELHACRHHFDRGIRADIAQTVAE